MAIVYGRLNKTDIVIWLIKYYIYICSLNERRCYIMLIIPIKEGENIDRALKRYKRKFDKTGVVRQLRKRQQFTKPSVVRRAQVQKAAYIQGLRDSEEN